MRRALEAVENQQSQQKVHDEVVLPAPVGGWMSSESIAKENPNGVEVAENFIATSKGWRPKGGSQQKATTGLSAVEDLLIYTGTTEEACFAASDGRLFDVTTPASPTTLPAAVVTGQTSNEYGQIMMAVAGNQFLLAFNGTNPHLVYDGTTWAVNTPAITGVSSANIDQAWVHSNRIWMVQKDSQKAWYLPVDSIGGLASDFAVPFTRGGKLLFGATMSNDSGAGSDDRNVFVSDKGQVAVFTGDYPGGPLGWELFGVYDIAEPMGRFAYQKVGGDLLIVTRNGIVPLSEIMQKDPAALASASITRNIEPDWKDLTEQFPSRNWRFVKWDNRNLGIIAIPSNSTLVSGSSVWGSTFIWGVTPWGDNWTIETPIGTPLCFVVNLQTGAWSKITGWDCRSMTIFKGDFLFGTSSGAVMFGDRGGNDVGKPYECRLAYWPSRFRYVGYKQFLQASAVFEHSTSFNPQVTIATDNRITWGPSPPPPPEDNTSSAWDSGTWDNAVFDAKGEKRVRYEDWVSLEGRGRVGAILLQMTFNNATTPDVEFTDVTVTYERGAVVT